MAQRNLSVQSLAGENLKVLWSRAAKLVVPVAAVGGFVADVLSPIGPFVSILATLTSALCVVSGVVWFGFKRRQIHKALLDGKIDAGEFERIGSVNAWSVAFAFNLMASIILMMFFGAQKVFASNNSDRGVVANTLPSVAALQAQLLGLQQKTEQIAATTERLETKADDMKKAIAQLDDRVAEIQSGDREPDSSAPANCPPSAHLSPYGKVFESADIRVEMGVFKEKNANGMQDVVLKIIGGPADTAGIDGKIFRYTAKPGFQGSGTYFTFSDHGKDSVRMLILPQADSEVVRVFLRDNKAFDVEVNAAKSKRLCVSGLES